MIVPFPQAHRHEQGAVLVVALVVLLVMTLLGVTGMQDAAMQERIAGNLKERHRSFLAAEAALRQGEQYVLDNTPADPCTEGTDPACGTVESLEAEANEVAPGYAFVIPDEPTLREITTASGATATGTKGGNRKLYTARYAVDATGTVGEAETALRSTYAVPLF